MMRPKLIYHLLKSNSQISLVESTLTFDCFLNTFSSDQIGQLSANASAKYCISLGCGTILSASFANLLNCSKGIKLISSFKYLKIRLSSSGESLLRLTISSIFLPSSKNKYSGDTNSKFLINLFTKKITGISPLLSNADITLLASTTSNNQNHFFSDCLNLCTKASSIFFDNSFTSFSVSLDLDIIDFISDNRESSFLTNLFTTKDQLVPETSFKSSSNSSGICITTSAIVNTFNTLDISPYLNTLTHSPEFIGDPYTVTKYIHELIGAGIIYQREIGTVKICYISPVAKSKISARNLEGLRK